MQSASIMQSGFNPLLSAELRSQNSEPHPVNRLGTQPGNRQPPEGRDSLPRHELAIEAPENAISHPNRHARRQQKWTKAAIKIASINMQGYGHQNVLHRQNKWNHNNQVIREKRIAVLLVQEAHMDDERKNQVENIFSRRMKIHASANPDNPAGKEGVAIILNSQLLCTQGLEATKIVPGRTISVQSKWHREEKLTKLVVYVPNEAKENKGFWEKLTNHYQNNPWAMKPDILAGNFNLVEDPIDCLPMHNDHVDVVDTLDDLRSGLRLMDGWKNTFPLTRAYTYLQSNGTRS